jgi:peroxidase
MAAGSRALVVAAAVLVAASCVAAVERYPPLPSGLSFDFYKHSCPQVERIAEEMVTAAVVNDPGLVPALIRMLFHDCAVQGCDGSVLLDNSTAGVSEKVYPPNKTLRPSAFNLINDIHERTVKECGLVVSCADIIPLTARDAARLVCVVCLAHLNLLARQVLIN